MANLMGLLLGSSSAKLQGMARSWQLDAGVDPRTLVSKLYNEMTDEQAIKSLLERLSAQESLVLQRILAESRGWIGVHALTGDLPFSEDQIHRLLARLEDHGIVTVETVRVFGNEIIDGPAYLNRNHPSTQLLVARIPPDLAHILHRIRQQMILGDQSDKSLHRLLGELDLPQLQALGERWKLPHSQQRFKRELMLSLEAIITQASNVNDALGDLGEDAQLVFRTVRDSDGRMSITALRQSLAIDEQALRKTISSLSSLFLVYETYVDGERFLFIPSAVASQDEFLSTDRDLGAAQEVPAPTKPLPVDYAFYFDLLALVNFFQQHRVELTVVERRIPRRVMGHLREQLIIGSQNGHGAAKLDYLFHVARSLHLLEIKDNWVVAGPRIGEWVSLGIVGQAEQLFGFWLKDDLWRGINSTLPNELDAELCRLFRQQTVVCLRRLEQGKWYSVESIVRCVLMNTLNNCADASTPCSRVSGIVPLRDLEAHTAGIAIAQLFHWMSALSIGLDDLGKVVAVQPTPLGAWILSCEGAGPPDSRRARMSVSPNFEVTVYEPDTEVWQQLVKFSLTVSVGKASVHQITKRKVQQAVYSGADINGLLTFLQERSCDGVPENVVASVEEWARSVKLMSLERLTILEVETEEVLDELLALPKYARWFGRRISPTVIAVQEVPDIKKLVREMRNDGYYPRLDY